MFFYLLILFTVLPALELVLLIEIGGHIGALNTVFLIIVTGILGASLARYQGFMVLQKIQNTVNQGQMPSDELQDGLMILVGGVVLLTPGFVTDTIGFMLLIPFTRAIIRKLLQAKFQSMIKNGQTMTFRTRRSSGYDDIDV